LANFRVVGKSEVTGLPDQKGEQFPVCPSLERGEEQRSKVECPVLLCFVVIFQSHYYFSSSVPFLQIPDRLRNLAQPVTPINDRYYLSGPHELTQDGQVLFVALRK
jgi:hypothetical protein